MSHTRTRSLSALAFTLAIVAGSAWMAVRNKNAPSPAPLDGQPRPIPVRPDTEPYEPYRFLYTTDQTISVYRERCKRDPDDYASRTTLGTLYLKRARETGDAGDHDRAGELFAEAQRLFPKYFPSKIGTIAVMNAKHKFAAAKAAAEALLKDEPGEAELRVLVADANVKLGEYDAADAGLRDLAKQFGDPNPAILARQARLLELRGQPDAAIDQLKTAAELEKSQEVSKVAYSWYASRIGEIQLAQGKLDGAAASLELAIRDNPGSPGLKVILAKIRLAQGRAKEAVTILEELLKADRELESFVEKVGATAESRNALKTSLASSQNFDTFLLLGEALEAAGEKERSAEAYRIADRKVDREEPIAVRELILSYCDRNHRLPRALELAAIEAKARRDVYSCDSLAWASFKNGKLPEAEKAAADALRLGTREAVFSYHAGKIAHAMKKPDRAKELLEKALQMNPHFSVEHAAEIKRMLGK